LEIPNVGISEAILNFIHHHVLVIPNVMHHTFALNSLY